MSFLHKTKEELEETLKEKEKIRTEKLRDISAAMDEKEGIPKLLHDVLKAGNELMAALNVVATAKNEDQRYRLVGTISVRVEQLLEELRKNQLILLLGEKNKELHQANEEIKSVREHIEQEKKEQERKVTEVIIRCYGDGGEKKEFPLSEGRDVIVGRENLRDLLISMNLNAKQIKSVSREHLRFTMNKGPIFCGVIGGNPTLLSRREVLPKDEDFSSNTQNIWKINDFFRSNYVYIKGVDGIFLAFRFSISPKS